jgi:hypothetical protein
MIDANYPLRKAYVLALQNANIGVPVYYQTLPNGANADTYIIIAGVTNNDASAKYRADTMTSIRVTIHSYKEKYNDGKTCDDLAGIILQAIYPNKQFVLDLTADNLQMVSTELSSDIIQDYTVAGQRMYIDRILIFRHRIFHTQ